MTSTPRPAGRGWAYLGAILGGAVSIAANVAHSYVRPDGAPLTWTPEVGAVIGSIFWPVALFVAVEILARVPWPRGKSWAWLRFGGLSFVAALAAIVSYRHLSGLLTHYGEDAVVATLGPLAVDGLMLMATGALVATGKRRPATVPPATRPAHAPMQVTVSPVPPAPAIPAATPRPVPVVVPPGAAMLPIVPATVPPAVAPETPADTPAPPVVPPLSANGKRPQAETRRLFDAFRAVNPRMSQEAIAVELGISRRTLRDALAATEPAPAPTARPRLAMAAS